MYKTIWCGSVLRARDVMVFYGQVGLELILVFSRQYILFVANGWGEFNLLNLVISSRYIPCNVLNI